jgi:hypothetical protein
MRIINSIFMFSLFSACLIAEESSKTQPASIPPICRSNGLYRNEHLLFFPYCDKLPGN